MSKVQRRVYRGWATRKAAGRALQGFGFTDFWHTCGGKPNVNFSGTVNGQGETAKIVPNGKGYFAIRPAWLDETITDWERLREVMA